MEAAGYPPSIWQALSMFIDGLPTTIVSYITLYDNIMVSLNEPNDSLLPSIQQIFGHVTRIDGNINRTRQLNHDHCTTQSTSQHNITLSSSITQIADNNNGTVCRCSNCNHLGHTDDTCFQPGGKMEGQREEYLANRGTKVQAHLVNTEDTPQTEITIDLSDEPVLTQEFAAMSLNTMNDIDFASYSSLQSVTSTLEGNSTPVAFASLHERFNMALNSACTNHIICD